MYARVGSNPTSCRLHGFFDAATLLIFKFHFVYCIFYLNYAIFHIQPFLFHLGCRLPPSFPVTLPLSAISRIEASLEEGPTTQRLPSPSGLHFVQWVLFPADNLSHLCLRLLFVVSEVKTWGVAPRGWEGWSTSCRPPS